MPIDRLADDYLMRALSFDIETSGLRHEFALQPWRVRQRKAWITTYSLSEFGEDHNGETVVSNGSIFPNPDVFRAILERAIAEDRPVLGWNIVFDAAWLCAYGLTDLVFRVRWIDGMRIWRHFFIEPEYDNKSRDDRKSYGLKECVKETLPHLAGYEQAVDYHSREPEDMAKLLAYNKIDTMAALLSAIYFWKQLSRRRRQCCLIEAASIPHIARANLAGMRVQMDKLEAVHTQYTEVANEMRAKLEAQGVTEAMIASPKQLAELLFRRWGLPPMKTSPKTGAASTDKTVLHELALEDSRVATIEKFREARTLINKFTTTIRESVEYNEDGNTYPNAFLFGTYSGRLTYGSKITVKTPRQTKKLTWVNSVEVFQTGFALHQMKRGPEFRSIIGALREDDVLVEFDAAGQEFRWMAIASGDATMMKLCQPGEDAHSYMTAKIKECDYHEFMARLEAKDKQAKSDRQLGKVGNLSLQYRTSAAKLRIVSRNEPYNIPMELEEAQRIWKVYRQTYRGVPNFWRSQIQFAKDNGYVKTLAGRRVKLCGDWTGPLSWSMESTSINYPIQGTGADQKYLAMSVLHRYLVQHDIRFAWDLHDGLYFYMPRAAVHDALRDIKYLLDNLPYEAAWGLKPPIPMPWDCKVGFSWGGLTEIKDVNDTDAIDKVLREAA